MARYTHFKQSEIAIWERYLALEEAKQYSFTYDVHLGEGVDPGPDYEPALREMWKHLTKLRADVVGEATDHVAIFEVKRRGDMTALGQLLTYRQLWRLKHRDGRRIRLVLVCEDVHPDVEPILRLHKVDIVRV
jgi:hypothetical protein